MRRIFVHPHRRLAAALFAAAVLAVGPAVSRAMADRGPAGGGDASNIVQVINQEDNALRADGSIQVNTLEGPNASPVNSATAFSSCTNCQSFAVALQINLISPEATNIQPQNLPVSVNYKCNTCYSRAVAHQYNLTVTNADAVQDAIAGQVRQIARELNDLESDGRDLSPGAVDAEVTQIVQQFDSLTASLHAQFSGQSGSLSPRQSISHST